MKLEKRVFMIFMDFSFFPLPEEHKCPTSLADIIIRCNCSALYYSHLWNRVWNSYEDEMSIFDISVYSVKCYTNVSHYSYKYLWHVLVTWLMWNSHHKNLENMYLYRAIFILHWTFYLIFMHVFWGIFVF